MSSDDILQTAKAMLEGKIGIVEGSRRLVKLGYEVTGDPLNKYFIPFVGIDSESDHIPLGDERKLWGQNGLEKADKELKEIEDHYRDWAIQSCKRLIIKYENT